MAHLGLGFRVQDLKDQFFGFRVYGLEFKGLGLWTLNPKPEPTLSLRHLRPLRLATVLWFVAKVLRLRGSPNWGSLFGGSPS